MPVTFTCCCDAEESYTFQQLFFLSLTPRSSETFCYFGWFHFTKRKEFSQRVDFILQIFAIQIELLNVFFDFQNVPLDM